MARRVRIPSRPGLHSRETLYVLLELGEALDRIVGDLGARPRNMRPFSDVCEDALKHIPETLTALAAAGVSLPSGERKKRTRPQRRRISRATWERLGRLADRLDLSRPQLLRALLRAELGLKAPLTPLALAPA